MSCRRTYIKAHRGRHVFVRTRTAKEHSRGRWDACLAPPLCWVLVSGWVCGGYLREHAVPANHTPGVALVAMCACCCVLRVVGGRGALAVERRRCAAEEAKPQEPRLCEVRFQPSCWLTMPHQQVRGSPEPERQPTRARQRTHHAAAPPMQHRPRPHHTPAASADTGSII